jgi:hypothetical protein
MRKWQEITLSGIMNLSVLILGSGVVAFLLDQSSISTVGLSILIGMYAMMFVAIVAYKIERN